MFRYKLMQFLSNKYGNDQLNMTMLVSALIIAFINVFFHFRVLYFLQTLLLVLYFLRFFSSNRLARSRENEKFLNLTSKFRKNQNSYNDFNTVYTNGNSYNKKTKKEPGYKYFKCPNCSAKLRVPKKKGKITITCPKCRTSFKGKS